MSFIISLHTLFSQEALLPSKPGVWGSVWGVLKSFSHYDLVPFTYISQSSDFENFYFKVLFSLHVIVVSQELSDSRFKCVGG